MVTRKLINPRTGLVAGLLLGLVGQSVAAAEEEVVVYGSEAARWATAVEARMQADLKEYLDALHREIRTQAEKDLVKVRAPELKLALAEVPTRG